jgi:dipeptidase E
MADVHPYPAPVSALLLSRGLGAVPAFVDGRRRTRGTPARVGFVPTASLGYAKPPLWITSDRRGLNKMGFDVVQFCLSTTTGAALDKVLQSLDVLYLAGGNTFVLLWHVYASGLYESLAGHLADGLIYIGTSAGAIVAGPDIRPADLMDDPRKAPPLTSTAGLELVDVVPIPHADCRFPPYTKKLLGRIRTTYGQDYPLRFVTDQQALRLLNGQLALIDSPTRRWWNPIGRRSGR